MLATALLLLGLTGCGAKQQLPGNRIDGNRLTIYLAVPENGASRLAGQAVMQGATLALDRIHARIGRYRITLRELDDSTVGNGSWSAAAASQAAQTAAGNRTTIGYIGDYNSGASAVSIPILNREGIAQVSPAASAVGLTSDGIGSSPGEPYAYYPRTLHTFARVVPSDAVQAQVQIRLQRQLGCRSVYVLNDGEYDGESLAEAFDELAQREHYPVVATQSYVPGETSYLSVAQTVAQSGATCVLIAAIPERNAAQVTDQVARQSPRALIFAGSGLAQPSFTDPALGGISPDIAGRVLVTAAGGQQGGSNRLMRAFRRAYVRRYGPALPMAVDGYEAMRLLLQAVSRATDQGHQQAERVRVVQDLMSTRHHRSPLGTYSIERNGNTSISSYGVYRIQAGALRYWRSITG